MSQHDDENAQAKALTRVRSATDVLTPEVRAVTAAIGNMTAGPVSSERDRDVNEALVEADARLAACDTEGAHAAHERAFQLNTTHPRALARYGLTLILVKHDRQRGMLFCEEAVRRGPPPPSGDLELLFALARASILCGSRGQAARALERARLLAPDDPRINAEAKQIGIRRRPVIPFLSRNHVLNRWLGELRAYLRRESRRHLEAPKLPPAG